MPESAGHIFVARLNAVRREGGEAMLERVLQQLSPEDQKTLRGLILPITWLPLSLNERLDAAIAEVLARGGDRSRAFLAMGRASADANLRGPHKTFVRENDPHYLLTQVPANHRLSYSHGRMRYEKTGETSGIARLFDSPFRTPWTCLTNVGWLERAIEISGGKAVQVTHDVCASRGGDSCEYVLRWS